MDFIGMIIQDVIALLEREYGLLKWNPQKRHLDVLIETVLSQHTSDLNSHRAFELLMDTFGSWHNVASAPVEHIAQSIRCGGLSKVKAVRIKQILQGIFNERGDLTLDFLESMSTTEAKDYLISLPGVGLKTASCVLLFSLGRPSLPVDTHIFRVGKRLGLLGPNVNIKEAHSLLQNEIHPAKIYQFHVHVIKHGRQVCRAKWPRCRECVLEKGCPSSLSPQKVALT
jgi:endonuclease-3